MQTRALLKLLFAATVTSLSFFPSELPETGGRYTATKAIYMCVRAELCKSRTGCPCKVLACNCNVTSAVNTPLWWILKTRYKKLVTRVESHASAVSQLESGEKPDVKAIIIITMPSSSHFPGLFRTRVSLIFFFPPHLYYLP